MTVITITAASVALILPVSTLHGLGASMTATAQKWYDSHNDDSSHNGIASKNTSWSRNQRTRHSTRSVATVMVITAETLIC